jgi:hypothetical protein
MAEPFYIEGFLVISQFYQCLSIVYSKHFWKVTKLLIDLTKKEFRSKLFNSLQKLETSFHKFERFFKTSLFLPHFDHLLVTIIRTDISQFAIIMILSLLKDSKLYLIAYYPIQMNKCQIYYKIYDKEIFIPWNWRQIRCKVMDNE